MKKHRMTLGDISVNYASCIGRALSSLGHDPNPLFEKYNISQDFLNTPSARISIPKFMRLGHDAIQTSNKPHLGLLMGELTRCGDLGLPGFVALTAPDLHHALKNLIHFELINSQNSRGHSRYYLEEDRAVCQFYSISPYNHYNYFVVDSMLSSWKTLAYWLSGANNLIHYVDVEYQQNQYRDQYELSFECPVNFGAERNALVFKRGKHLIKNQFESFSSFLESKALCEKTIERLLSGQSYGDRVTDLIAADLSGSPPSIADVAKKMGMAGWTLRRRLIDEGQQFKNLLDNTRADLAGSYVKDTEHNFTEIAFLLGFSSPAAFQRAFKRWYECSPGEMRERIVSSR